ncbi:glutathione S-transferase [Hyphococcus sp.]|uniref:glutathione S-transferase n=1 Tax=Hyphococcus sp. TaxID=2038636 RepID=UPI0035C67B8B
MGKSPILYSFRRCPYAMRARMAIAASGTPVRLREILLRDKPEEMLAASPKGTVPVVVDGKRIIDESLDVMNWALAQNDPEDWLSRKDDGLIAENDGPFKHHLDRYKYSTRYEDADAEEHRAAGFEFLQKLEARLAHSDYLHGAERGFSDIAIFPFVRQFRIADKDWFDAAPIPNVQRWLKTLMESVLFKSVMEKYPLWKETGEEYSLAAVPIKDSDKGR